MRNGSKRVALGLGTNLGEREANLASAVELLLEKHVISAPQCSSIYESKALLTRDAPLEWDVPYLNMAVTGMTALTPVQLLEQVKLIEYQMGRRPGAIWAPRVIDIDILLYANEIVELANLKIPHAELSKRAFALLPLAEVCPEWQHPVLKADIQELCSNIDRSQTLYYQASF